MGEAFLTRRGLATPAKGLVTTAWDTNGYPTALEIVGFSALAADMFYVKIYAEAPIWVKYLQRVKIHPGPTSMGNRCFYGNSALVSVECPPGLKSIGTEAFRNDANLEAVTLRAGLLSIANQAFYGCTKLVLGALPDGLESIGSNAFCNCDGLVRIWIPASCTTVTAATYAGSPFYNCADTIVIYCEAASKPEGWGTYWNYYSSSGQLTVVWDTTLAEFNAL